MEQILKSRYRTGEKISETPFSVTYRGLFVGNDKKQVVIKIYKRGTLNSSLIRSMKQRVKEFSLISHHGIAKLFDGDYGWQGFYYVREFIEGRTLQAVLSSGEKLGIERAIAIADQALLALEAAHAKGIIHGGLKPANIIIDNQGIIKLADFVIEGEIKDSLPQRVQEIIVNAKYASPEELEGNPATHSAAIFSLGLILYEMATGKYDLVEPGLGGGIKKLREPILSKEALASLPRYLAEIIFKALQKDPLIRFSCAAEFRESLEKKSLVQKAAANEEFMQVFENVVTQYGGGEIDHNSETPEEVGQVKLRSGKEKHRNWILAVILGASVVLGILYAFFFSI